MGQSYVGKRYITGITGTDCTLDLTSGWTAAPSAGDVVFFHASAYKASASPNPTFSTPAGWTSIGQVSQFDACWALFYRVMQAGDTTVTSVCDTASSFVFGYGFAYSGFQSSPVDDSSNDAYTTSNNILRAGSVTVANQPVWVVMFGSMFHSGPQSFTPPSGFIEDVDEYQANCAMQFFLGHKEWTANEATGALDATFSATTNDKHAWAIALKEASAATGLWLPSHYDGGLYERMHGGI